jgi:hypothetical protein
MKHFIPFYYLTPTILASVLATASAHEHFSAGVFDQNGNGQYEAGEPLALIGNDGTSKTFHLLPRRTGLPAGGRYVLDERPRDLFPNDGFTLIVLSDGQYDAPSPQHPRSGAQIWMEIVSVAGPPGATFSFWDENQALIANHPTRAFPANQPTGNFAFVLSEGPDEANEDPHGHIHGRTWTADMPGDYQIGFRLVDRSTNRAGGQPWHAPSVVYTWHFKAGPDFQFTSIEKHEETGVTLTWPSRMGTFAALNETGVNFKIMRSTTMDPGSWEAIGNVVGTSATTASFIDTNPPAGRAFYRLSYHWVTQP